MKPLNDVKVIVVTAALESFDNCVSEIFPFLEFGFQPSISFCEQLVIASAAKAANKIFFIFCVF